ncbi:pig-Q [Purpureocillium takamizusanense]|uniref:Pig-Q n=1 Tax=Purpureocillium takamizusanense TaxID=2060973 RepID=A0A9Q8QF03_9HYPO|nr:pig-Q [Purpureocillium takamizusanense]UNI17512.1 pig-Q [Purpureocillium takamizusanense]
MHPFSILTLGIFVAGYITARWDLVTRLYELAIFAAEYGVVIRVARGVVGLTALFLTIFLPVVFLARKETHLVSIPSPAPSTLFVAEPRQHPRAPGFGLSAREQLRRRGSF